MPTVESLLQSTLGALCSGRCYPLVNPSPVIGQSYITFQEIHGKDLLITPPNKGAYRFQFDVWAGTYDGAKALAALVKPAIDNSTAFASSIIDRFDGFEEVTKEYRHTLDYYIWM